GASAISRFPQGYAQNAAATSDFARAIREGRLATARGHAFSGEDLLRGRMIEMLLCDFAIDRAGILRAFPQAQRRVDALLSEAAARFAGMVALDAKGLSITPRGRPLARMIARVFDGYDLSKAGHSSAV
ncbi:MAG: coproporphyrinogen III oxidase, partial [Gemmobacter sp.]